MPNVIQHSTLLIYADDCKLSLEIKSPFDAFRLQADLDRLANWGTLNHLPLQIEKCMVLHFYRIKEPFLFDYSVSGTYLDTVDTFKDLGVLFSTDFSFLPHLNNVISKAFRNLGWIKRTTKSFNDIGAIKVLYNSYVLPPLIFASAIWSPYTKDSITRIERVQHALVRYLAFKNGALMSFCEHDYSSNSARFNILAIMLLHTYHDCILAYLIHQENC